MRRKHEIESSGDDINLFSLDMYMMLSAMGITLGVVFIVLKVFLPDFFTGAGDIKQNAPKLTPITEEQWKLIANDHVVVTSEALGDYIDRLYASHPDSIFDVRLSNPRDSTIDWLRSNPKTYGIITVHVKHEFHDEISDGHTTKKPFISVFFVQNSKLVPEMEALRKWQLLYLLIKSSQQKK